METSTLVMLFFETLIFPLTLSLDAASDSHLTDHLQTLWPVHPQRTFAKAVLLQLAAIKPELAYFCPLADLQPA